MHCVSAVFENDFNLSLRKCRLKKNRRRKGLQKQKKRQVLPVSVPEERLENLSCLFPSSCFLFYFVLSALNSSPPPPPISLFPIILLLPLPYLIFPTCLSLCQYIFLSPLCALLPHYPLTACHSVTLLCLLYSQLLSLSPYRCNSITPPLFFYFSLCCSVCLPLSLLAANICDEEMLLCQNGGTCYQNQKCICPPEFKGVLCQHSRCEAGRDCSAASSLHLSMATLLLCTLLAHMLAMLTPH